MPDSTIDIRKLRTSGEAFPDVWQSFRNEMNRLFDRFDAGFWFPPMRMSGFEPFRRSGPAFESSAPAVDMTEDSEAYTITAELPGLDEMNIDVSLSGNRLLLMGEKRQEKEEKTEDYCISERSYGTLRRSFRLPDGIDQDQIAATYANGVLTIVLPKTPATRQQPKKIEVKPA